MPLLRFIEKVTMNSMPPWEAATETFGRDLDFLQFNSLAIAFRQGDGKSRIIFVLLFSVNDVFQVRCLGAKLPKTSLFTVLGE